MGAAVLVHCAHHKVGTVWFKRVLSGVARTYGLRRGISPDGQVGDKAEVVLFHHAKDFDREAFEGKPLRGTHMIRDPRDVVVSGYFYHLWTAEAGAHVPRAEFGGLSYQAYLNSVDEHDGLLAEIRRAAAGTIAEMAAWDYDQPDFLELRYEDLVMDERAGFVRIFTHYGFHDAAIERCLEIVEKRSFERVTGRARGDVETHQHLRSGKVGEWQEHFDDEHRALFKELAGRDVIALGYERSDAW